MAAIVCRHLSWRMEQASHDVIRCPDALKFAGRRAGQQWNTQTLKKPKQTEFCQLSTMLFVFYDTCCCIHGCVVCFLFDVWFSLFVGW